jgi:glycosyltransferase involved in cell wall biosynthesis
MRILQVVHRPQRRGAELFALALSEALGGLGHESPIVYLYPADPVTTPALELREMDSILSLRERRGLERIGLDPWLLAQLRRATVELDPQIVQLNGSRTVKYGAALAAISGRRSWKLLYRNIGDPAVWVRGSLRRLLFKWLVIPRMDGIVAVSQATLERLRAFYDPNALAVHIPRGVDPDLLIPTRPRSEVRRAVGTPAEAPVLICVGSLAREKRLDRALEVAKNLSAEWPELELWLVGSGPERADLLERATTLGIASRVRFLGAQVQVADFLSGADVLLLTSDTEGMPGVVLEAATVGRPAVATRVGGVAECIRHGETGYVVDPGDLEALTEASGRLLANAEERQRMGASAQAWVRGAFTVEHLVEAYLGLYLQLIGASRP